MFQHIAKFFNHITAKGRNKVVYFYDLAHVTDLGLIPEEILSITGSLGLTGGEYRTRERIHRGMADPRLLAIPAS